MAIPWGCDSMGPAATVAMRVAVRMLMNATVPVASLVMSPTFPPGRIAAPNGYPRYFPPVVGT